APTEASVPRRIPGISNIKSASWRPGTADGPETGRSRAAEAGTPFAFCHKAYMFYRLNNVLAPVSERTPPMSFVKAAPTLLPLLAGIHGPGAAIAQSGSVTLAGVVKDSSGLATPGVLVKIVNVVTNVTIDTYTNEHGAYSVGALAPGNYKIEVAL